MRNQGNAAGEQAGDQAAAEEVQLQEYHSWSWSGGNRERLEARERPPPREETPPERRQKGPRS
jgi:hypothetical protein